MPPIANAASEQADGVFSDMIGLVSARAGMLRLHPPKAGQDLRNDILIGQRTPHCTGIQLLVLHGEADVVLYRLP